MFLSPKRSHWTHDFCIHGLSSCRKVSLSSLLNFSSSFNRLDVGERAKHLWTPSKRFSSLRFRWNMLPKTRLFQLCSNWDNLESESMIVDWVPQLSWTIPVKSLRSIQAANNLNDRLPTPDEVEPVVWRRIGQWSEWKWGRWQSDASGKARLHSSSQIARSRRANLLLEMSWPWFHVYNGH